MARARLPRRQVVLFLTTVLLPCVLLTVLGARMLQQERELEEKRFQEDRRRRLTDAGRQLLATLEQAKLRAVAARGATPLPDPVVFTGLVRQGRLLLPWDADSARGTTPLPDPVVFAGAIGQGRPLPWDADRSRARSPASPAQKASARLLLARTLVRRGERRQAEREYRELERLPLSVTDEHGIPVSFCAASAVAPERERLGSWIRAAVEGSPPLPPAAVYLLRDLATRAQALEWPSGLDARLRDLEQAEALQNDFPRLSGTWQKSEPVWITYGDPAWLVSLEGTLLVAVRAERVLRGLDARPDSGGEPLGDAFPGLRVAIAPVVPPRPQLRPSFLAGAMGLVLVLTAFSGYLLWRDVRRELRLAELRSQFIASVSHELKTPLAAIRMFTENLRTEDDLDREIQREYLETIWHESERLSRLVDNVLEFAHIEQGRKIYRLRPTSLEEVVSGAARAIEYPLAQSGFRLEVAAEPGLPQVEADRDALQQAILNLLTNAMKYSGEAREIALRLSRDNGHAVIQVVDHGPGIPKEEQPRIFERFFRGRDSEAQRIPGTGLGLTLVAHIAQAHGGGVEVSSCPGEGSTFTIRLPLPEERS